MSYILINSSCNNFSQLPVRDGVLARIECQKFTIQNEMEWRHIPGHPEYEISSSGMVRNNKSYGGKQRMLVQTLRNNKYFYVTLTLDGKRIGYPVDKLMIMTFFSIRKENIKSICHIDNNKHNNQLSNLNYRV